MQRARGGGGPRDENTLMCYTPDFLSEKKVKISVHKQGDPDNNFSLNYIYTNVLIKVSHGRLGSQKNKLINNQA